MANGDNTFRPQYVNVSNIEAIAHHINSKEIEVEITAKYFMEPISNFAFVTPNAQNEISFSCKDYVMFTNGFNAGVITMQNTNIRLNAIRLDFPKPLTPSFPLIAVFTALTDKDIAIMSV